MRYGGWSGPAVLAVLLAVTAAGGAARAQEGIAHLILEVLETPQDQIYGYRVYHEEAKVEYRLMMAPDAMKAWRCNLTGLDRITVDEAAHSYEGRDGKPCGYASFRPEVVPPANDELPIPVGPSRPPCPTCPG